VVLLVQPSVFQEMKPAAEDAEEVIKYRKDVEEGLWAWIEMEGCRHEVLIVRQVICSIIGLIIIRVSLGMVIAIVKDFISKGVATENLVHT